MTADNTQASGPGSPPAGFEPIAPPAHDELPAGFEPLPQGFEPIQQQSAPTEPLKLVPGQTTQEQIDAAPSVLFPGETTARVRKPPEPQKPEDVAAQQGWDLSGFNAPPKPPGWIGTAVEAGRKGLVTGLTESAQVGTPFKDRPAESPDTSYVGQLLAKPVSEGWSDPKWWIAHIAHGTAESSPSLAIGAAGAYGGGLVGAAVPVAGETGVGEALGAVGGGATGFALGSAIQTLAPAYQKARADGLDHDAAVDRAIKETGISTGFGAIMGLAPAGVGQFLKGPISRALAEIFVVQPGLGAAQQVATGASEGQMPTADELATGYAENVGMGVGLAGAHEGVRRLLGHGDAQQPAGTEQPASATPAAPAATAEATDTTTPAATPPAPTDVAARANAVADQLEAQGQPEAAARLRAQYAQPTPEESAVAPEPQAAIPQIVAPEQTPVAHPAPPAPAEGQSALDTLKQTAEAIGSDARAKQAETPAATDQQLASAEQKLQQEAGPTRQPVGQQLIQGITQPANVPKTNSAAQTVSPSPATVPQEMNAARALPYRPIRDDQAVIPSSGQAFPVQYAIADAHNLVTSHHDDLSPNQNYPQALQPRSRERAETEAQLASILNGGNLGQFRPELLGEGADAANGAPIVGEDGLVEGGNARTMAIRRAYDRGLPQAEEYRQYLASQGYPVDGVAAPMLVRVNKAGMDMPAREQLARDLNVPAQAAMSPSDQAMADAAQMRPDQLRSYQGGDIFSGANQPFLVGLMRGLVRPNELPALLNPEGGLSPAGRTRMRNALLAKAYGDSGMVSTLTEDADNNIKSIGNAMMDAAPAWAQMRDAIAQGRVPEAYDLTSPILEAVRLISHARDTGRNVVEFVSQRGMLGAGVDPKTEGVLSWMLGAPDFTRRYGREKIADALTSYANNVSALGPNLLGNERAQPLDMVEQARQAAQGAAGDLFAQPVGRPEGAGPVRQDIGAGRPEVQRPGPAPAGLEPPAGGAEPVAEPAQRPAETTAGPTRPVAQVTGDEAKALFDEAQSIMRSLPSNMGKILQNGGKYTPAQQAKLDRLAAIDRLLPQGSDEWNRIMGGSRAARDEIVAAQRAAHGQEQLRQAQEAGFNIGDKVSFRSRSFLPHIPGALHEGVIRQSIDGTIYVASDGKRLGLLENPWQKVAGEAPLLEQQPTPAATETAAKVIPGKHTKTGADIWTVQMPRVSDERFAELRKDAKGLDGYYSSFRGRGATPGWIFKTDAQAQEFARRVNGEPAAESIAPAAATEPASAQASGEGKTTGLPAEEPAGTNPQISLADAISRKLGEPVAEGVKPLSANELIRLAELHYGSKLAEGKFTRADIYDALELGVNKLIRESAMRLDPNAAPIRVRNIITRLEQLKEDLPTQTVRAGEKETHQQFSTPPDYAYAAVRAAGIRPTDRVIEPSAGTGSLVAHAMNAHPAEVITNEISPQRAALVESLGPNRAFHENAEQLHNILPNDVRPTVAVMNPPFSQTAGRMGNRTDTTIGAQHVEQALARLELGGRLVAIVGGGMRPYDENAPIRAREGTGAAFRDWWRRIGSQYDVRANIGVSGDIYKKYGTGFPTRLLVIDKAPPSGRALVTGDVDNAYDLVNRLEDIRNDRPEGNSGQQVAGQPSGPPLAPGSERPAGPAPTVLGATAAPGVREGAAGAGSGRPVPREPGIGGREAAEQPTRPGQGNAAVPGEPQRPGAGRAEPRPAEAVDVSQQLGTGGAEPNGALVQPERGSESLLSASGERTSLAPSVQVKEAAADPATGGEITENVYEPYRPQRITIEGAKAHPGALVQSAAMASVMPPVVDYAPRFSPDFVKSGALSDAQLEAVTYAGHAHSQMLPALEGAPQIRRGFFLGDGTGTGKGRQVAGMMLDNWNQGRQKHVWISEKKPLMSDARRDWSGLGQDPNQIFDVSKTKAGDKIGASKGIAFTTYDTLRGGEKQPSVPGEKPRTRIDQLADWLGKDFDGVIAFDEAHNLGNALAQKGSRGVKDASKKALAGIELQNRLPNARVVYVSATGATEVSNLAYADRLGLWGHGTAFANKADFISKIANGGVAAMELVARDMKAMGSYISRNLSYDGVDYDRLEHTLQPHDRQMYDKLAEAWQVTLHNFQKALEITGGDKNANAKSASSSAFWGGHQRFFNQILTSLQMPTIIKGIESDLAEGRQAVVQLVNTNEASLDRALAKKNPEEDLEDLDLSPKDQLMQLVDHTFPTQKYEEYVDDNGNVRSRPVVDSNDNPVQDKEAVAMKERLLDQLGAISAPDGPLEMLHNHFGVDNVAEVTGRKQRVVLRPDENGQMRKVRESRPGGANEAEGNAFQAGKKKVLVFSSAGGTGRSYHADNTSASAGARRSHYLAQPGWRADTAIQGFGRTHRTNQASAPMFHLVTTDLQGQRRFISSIARRLAQLGALTKGERRTGDQGLFNSRDNLESPEARDALYRFFRDLHSGQMGDMHIADFERETGLKLRTPEGSLRRDLPDIPQFLNRLLSMKIDPQNRTFSEFDKRLSDSIENAAARGTLDTGVETLKADRLTKQHESVVYTDPKSGAETKYVRLSQENRNNPRSFDSVTRPGLDLARNTKFFVKSIRTEKTYAVSETSAFTDPKTGKVSEQYKLTHPLGYDYTDRYKIDGWDAKKYWQRIDDPTEARAAWDASVAKVPEFNKKDLHLITGAVLPIWDRLEGRPNVYRLQTTDTGERMLGRQIPNDSVTATLQRLGAGQEGRTFAPADVVSKVLDGETAQLANGWSIVRSYVAGQPRIEVRGPSFPDMERMRQTGLFNERIQYNTRFFIPTGADAERVMQRLVEQHPVVSVSGGTELREGAPAGWTHTETSNEGESLTPTVLTDDFHNYHAEGGYPQTAMGYHDAAREWTLDRGQETGNEHVVAFNDGEGAVTYAGTNGARGFVRLPDGVTQAGSSLIIHHNHPSDSALSTADIAALVNPGLSRIMAHGSTGHVSSAELTAAAQEWVGRLNDVDKDAAFKKLSNTIAAAADPIREALQASARSGQYDKTAVARIGHELLGRALDAAGLIHYVSSRGLAPLSPAVARNLIAEGATRARMFASFRAGEQPAFIPHEDLTNAVLDRSAAVVRPDEALDRAFGPIGEIAGGRSFGEGGDGRGEAGVAAEGGGEDAGNLAGQSVVGRGLAEESELPTLDAEGHEEAGHAALAAGDIDAATHHFSEAARARGGNQGPPPPTNGGPSSPPPPGGGPPASGPMSPAEREAALNQIMHTDDSRWIDQVKQTVKNLQDQPGLKFRQYWQDNLAALEIAEKGAFGGGLAPGRISPTMSARFARNWQSTLDIAVNHAQLAYNPDTGVIEPIEGSKPFRDILRPLGEDQKASGRNTVQDFALWSIVKRADRLMAEGRERNVPADIIARAKNIDAEYQNPDGSNLFQQVHGELQEWNGRMLDLGEAAGLINPESRALWENNDYVPFYRALEDDVTAPGAGGRGIANARSPIRQLLGGEAKVNNIYENMVMNAAAMVRRSMANIAMQKARDMLVEHTTALTPMSKDARAVFGDPAVQASLRAAGIDPAQMTAQAKQGAADLFGALRKRDPDVISVMDNGKPLFYRVNDPMLLQSLTAAGPSTMSGLGRILTAPARLLRGAVIFDPAFMLAHNLRMAQHAFILTGANPIRSIGEAIRQGKGISPVALRMMAAGAMSGKYDVDLPRNVRTQIASPEYQATLLDTPVKAARFLRDFSEHAMQAADIGPRIAVYQRALAQGASEAEAMNHARDLLDFSTRGAGGAAMFLAQTIPFLNARWQGMARTYRGFTGSERNGILLRGALVTAASLALWSQNKDDPEYQRKEDWDRQYAWQINMGNGTWFRLPKPFELGALFGTVPEIIADYFDNGSSRTMMNATGAMFSNVFKFNPIPVAIRPVLEAWWNHDSFTGQPIVNEREQALDPDLQYGPTDSTSVVALTQAFNSVSPMQASPAIVQHLLRGYLAGWGTYITAASDYLGEQAGVLPSTPSISEPPVVGRFVRETPDPANRLMTDFYDLKKSLDSVGASIKVAQNQQDASLQSSLLAKHPDFDPGVRKQMDEVGTQLSKIRGVYQKMQMNPAASSQQKTAARNTYYRQRDQLLDANKGLLRRAEGLSAQP
jgi:P-loop containing NTP hydrolase pore-1/C-terminal domain on Strawberry notch homologue/Large polyvalent protein associated domain 38/ddrB-like ParB superfamily domain